MSDEIVKLCTKKSSPSISRAE